MEEQPSEHPISEPKVQRPVQLKIWVDTADGCEILHQLIGGKHPILMIYRVSTKAVQDFFHPRYQVVSGGMR